jgi:diadenosine tetraphosphate (Ap4A) HIT family hydrolase
MTDPAAAADDLRAICTFCSVVGRRRESNPVADLLPGVEPEDSILLDADDVVVVPAVGSFRDGYVVLVPRAHVPSFGHLPEDLDEAVDRTWAVVARALTGTYGGGVLGFEHGAVGFRRRGGVCSDHAHQHVLPVPAGLTVAEEFARELGARDVPFGVAARRAAAGRGTGYLWLADASGRCLVSTSSAGRSQYFRRLVAARLGRPDWDWHAYPGADSMRRTVTALRPHLEVERVRQL